MGMTHLKGKALFNLLRISWREDPSLKVAPWQVEDLKDLSIDALFARLKKMGIVLDEESFAAYAATTKSPEELAECLSPDEENLEEQDKIYLLVFELWRKLLPDQLSLSIFFDELDHLVELYDSGELKEEERLQRALSAFEDLLDDTTDHDGPPQEVFADLCSYCAHDIERFVFDYILDQIQIENITYASELLDAFYDFVKDKRQFDFLRACLFIGSDIDKANILIERLLEQLADDPDLELLLTVAESLIHRADARLFRLSVSLALPLIEIEDEFQDLLKMVAEFYRCLDREDEEKMIQQLLHGRSKHSLDAPLDPKDHAIAKFSTLLSAE